ncbi:MAG: phosphatase PAP2 family protein [Bacteroidetes bacterium]|jgi:membrane-associated phospholipid phosphatase|nr:phosphatase PAP2 family protein [Bacteroidota bacterium]
MNSQNPIGYAMLPPLQAISRSGIAVLIWLTLLVQCTFLPVSLFGKQTNENDSSLRFLEWMVHDPLRLAGNLNENHLFAAVTTGIGLTAFAIHDRASTQYFQDHFSHSRFLRLTNELGSRNVAPSLSAAIFGASLFTENRQFQDAAFTSLQAVLNTYLTVGAAKYLFARKRPGQHQSPYRFNLLEIGATSFPSGTTASAFALITPWVVYYPNILTYRLMALPVGTGIARTARGYHWTTDALAGALIGAYWGYTLSKMHLNIPGKRNLTIHPLINDEKKGFFVSVSF